MSNRDGCKRRGTFQIPFRSIPARTPEITNEFTNRNEVRIKHAGLGFEGCVLLSKRKLIELEAARREDGVLELLWRCAVKGRPPQLLRTE